MNNVNSLLLAEEDSISKNKQQQLQLDNDIDGLKEALQFEKSTNEKFTVTKNNLQKDFNDTQSKLENVKKKKTLRKKEIVNLLMK